MHAVHGLNKVTNTSVCWLNAWIRWVNCTIGLLFIIITLVPFSPCPFMLAYVLLFYDYNVRYVTLNGMNKLNWTMYCCHLANGRRTYSFWSAAALLMPNRPSLNIFFYPAYLLINTGWAKKSKPDNFCINFVYCHPICIIFGTYTLQEICNRRMYN